MESEPETLVILDFGSQYTQLIARRTRELNIFSVILPFSISAEELLKLRPKGIILSGGPNSVYAENAPRMDNKILKLNIPVLGICYGLQLLTQDLGGKVAPSTKREYGLASLSLKSKSKILGPKTDKSTIWMSHGDHVATPPENFQVSAVSEDIICAVENAERNLYGLQFHPEVSHTEYGKAVLGNFLVKVCKFKQNWSAVNFIDHEIDRIRKLVKKDKVICALSGGVDSSVAATLVHQAIGSQQTCIFVDTGLLRANEYEEVLKTYKRLGLNVIPIQAKSRFLQKLKGITDPEKKRKIIGKEFIKIFEEEAGKIKGAKFLVQGTLYPDVIESVSVNGPSVTIKSHHNVGGLPKRMNLKLIEPLRQLFKDEVRTIGKNLGLPQALVHRQPFPGPGLAIRILGEVNEENLGVLKQADSIVREEIINSQVHKNLWQYFAVLLPIKTVGVMGDKRTYEKVAVIRIVESVDGMTADWSKIPHTVLERISGRIISEVRGINRVVYDVTSKPPGTIEWE